MKRREEDEGDGKANRRNDVFNTIIACLPILDGD